MLALSIFSIFFNVYINVSASFRLWHVPMLPSLTWQKLCPASSPSNLPSWMVNLPTHTLTLSLSATYTQNHTFFPHVSGQRHAIKACYYLSSVFVFLVLALICFWMGFCFPVTLITNASVTHGRGNGLLHPYCREKNLYVNYVCTHTAHNMLMEGRTSANLTFQIKYLLSNRNNLHI